MTGRMRMWGRRPGIMVVTAVLGVVLAWLILGPAAVSAWNQVGAVNDFSSGWPEVGVPDSLTVLDAGTAAPVAEGSQLAVAAGWSQVTSTAGSAGPVWEGFPVVNGYRSCAEVSGVASAAQLGAYARAVKAPLALVSAEVSGPDTVTTLLCTVSARKVSS